MLHNQALCGYFLEHVFIFIYLLFIILALLDRLSSFPSLSNIFTQSMYFSPKLFKHFSFLSIVAVIRSVFWYRMADGTFAKDKGK